MSFAVIIPCYKQAHYLERCLNSVVGQVTKDDRIVVVYAADERRAVEEAIEPFRNKIVAVESAPEGYWGVSKARNRGVRALTDMGFTGVEWIKFLDADDLLAPFALETFRGLSIPGCVWVVSGDMVKVIDGKIQSGVFRTNWQHIDRQNPALVSACFIRSVPVFTVRFDEGIQFEEDWDLWLRFRAIWAARNPLEPLFTIVPFPVCYYWISEAERAAKVRDHTVEYEGSRIDVREYFRRKYKVTPQ